MKLLTRQMQAVHCPKCYRYQVVDKRYPSGKLRLSCTHKVKPTKLIEVAA